MQPKLRLRDRRRRLMWVKVAAGSAVVALSLGAVFYVSRLPELNISEVKVGGAHIVKPEAVQALAEEKLAGTYGVLIPRSNAVFAPKDEIEKAVLSSFPEVASVSISGEGFKTLAVSLKERAPSALWCTGDAKNPGECYAMDADGFIFMKAPVTDGYVRYFGALPAEPVGSTFLAGDFKALDGFIRQTVSALNRAAESVTIAPNNDATLAFAGGGELRFVRTEDTPATLENIASVFASQSFKTKRNFEYADFRYDNKVYVKFKGE